jgi:ABC-type Fe3+/spermidine/putrescine transport system ATPase subunit
MSGTIHIEQLSVTVGDFRLRDISLAINEHEYFVVLGPTGAGKTVLLECIAGLIQPDRGAIRLGDRDVTALPPERRRIGYLPQDYALFPHLTVRENLGFGLVIQKRASEIPAKLERYASLLGIGHLFDRYPARLSGGEKQRIALGRALSVDPEIMLLDEPLSALDVATRARIGDELRGIHDRTGITTLHICHNFDETLRLADRVALVRGGRLVQVGTPEEIMRRPASLFAAEFVRTENVFAGVAETTPAGARVRLGPLSLATDCTASGKVYATIRPDDVDVLTEGESRATAENLFHATVEQVKACGDGYEVRTTGALPLAAFVGRAAIRRHRLEPGCSVHVRLPPAAVNVFPAVGEEMSDWHEHGDSAIQSSRGPEA